MAETLDDRDHPMAWNTLNPYCVLESTLNTSLKVGSLILVS